MKQAEIDCDFCAISCLLSFHDAYISMDSELLPQKCSSTSWIQTIFKHHDAQLYAVPYVDSRGHRLSASIDRPISFQNSLGCSEICPAAVIPPHSRCTVIAAATRLHDLWNVKLIHSDPLSHTHTRAHGAVWVFPAREATRRACSWCCCWARCRCTMTCHVT